MRALALAALALALGAGCYAPSVPSGAYLCNASDHACPSGQRCSSCGLCVEEGKPAVCGFAIDVHPPDGGVLTVEEHEKFPVTITALGEAPDGGVGTPVSDFDGTVALDFALPTGFFWADVVPGAVKLTAGRAEVMLEIDRETIPPQAPRVVAYFANASSASAPVRVRAPRFVADPKPLAVPPYGWASALVAEPSVLVDDGGEFRMYFDGQQDVRSSPRIGVALSDDGVTFAPAADPVFPGPDLSLGGAPVLFPAAFRTPAGWNLVYYTEQRDQGGAVVAGLNVVTSKDGLSPFELIDSVDVPRLKDCSCDFCNARVWLPSVVADPGYGDAGSKGWLLFFSAIEAGPPAQCNPISLGGPPPGAPDGGAGDGGGLPALHASLSIGLASSTDGVRFDTEPAPVLSGVTGGEAYLAAPAVYVDGSVFKMWYTFAHGDAFDTCAPVAVGYATSTDGFYWVRSPSNPVFDLATDGVPWAQGATGVISGSVLPVDGKDPSKGLALYFSTMRDIPGFGQCAPNGIGRAVALPPKH